MKNVIGLIIALVATGCVSSRQETIGCFDFSVRDSVADKLMRVVDWYAPDYGWESVLNGDNLRCLKRGRFGDYVIVELRQDGAKCYVEMTKCEGFGYDAQAKTISETYNSWVSELADKVKLHCNAYPPDADYFKNRYSGLNAKGCADAWKKEYEEYAVTWAKYQGHGSDEIKRVDPSEYKQWQEYEKDEIRTGTIRQVADKIIPLAKQFNAVEVFENVSAMTNGVFVESVAVSNAAHSLTGVLLEMRSFAESYKNDQNYNCVQDLVRTAMTIRVKTQMSKLVEKNCSHLARFLVDEFCLNENLKCEPVFTEVIAMCKTWEYDHTPEGILAAKKKKAENKLQSLPCLPNLYLYIEEKRELAKKRRRNSYDGPMQRRGFEAEGITAEFDAIAKATTEEGAAKFRNLRMREKYVFEMAEHNVSVHSALAKHERQQIAIGRKMAFEELKVKMRDEVLDYIALALPYMDEPDVIPSDETRKAIVSGLRKRSEHAKIVFAQADKLDVLEGASKDLLEGQYLHKLFEEAFRSLVDAGHAEIVTDICESNAGKDFGMNAMEISKWRSVASQAREVRSVKQTGPSSGSGWFVNDDHVITCAHVVSGKTNLSGVLLDGEKLELSLVAEDKDHDIAILMVKGGKKTSRQTLRLRESRAKLADKVYTIGYPLTTLLGADQKYAEGAISGLSGVGNDARYYQVSVPIQPGNSGGALLDEKGCVVGLVSATLDAVKTAQLTGTLPQNVNYAVKARYIRDFLEDNDVSYLSGAEQKGMTVEDATKATLLILAE